MNRKFSDFVKEVDSVPRTRGDEPLQILLVGNAE